MKVEFKKDDAAATGGMAVRGMSLASGKEAKMFTILSDGLYRNPIEATIREVCSNARDAHAMGGCIQRPFDVRIPNWSHPYFEVRDYGIGLTPEHAMETIFSFLGSDKDDSDDFIGGWGLGSKSPFSYTSSYEVTIYKDGLGATFNCWKDDQGMPNIVEFNRFDTKEENGVHFRVPVEIQGVTKFRSACTKYINQTDFPIKALGNESDLALIKQCRTILAFEHGGFKFRLTNHCDNDPNDSIENFLLQYGGFVYSVSGLDGLEDETRTSLRNIRAALAYSIVIDVPVGACHFSVSRDTLRGTERTIRFINQSISALVNYLAAEAEQYQHKHLFPVYDKVKAAKDPVNGKVSFATLTAISEEVRELNKNSQVGVFEYFSYQAYANNLMPVDVKERIQQSGYGALFQDNSFIVEATVGRAARVLSNKKKFDSARNLRWLNVSYNYSKGKDVISCSQGLARSAIKLNLMQPINGQIRFLWIRERLHKKYASLNKTTSSVMLTNVRVLVVEAPTEAEALSIYGDLGFSDIALYEFTHCFDYAAKGSKARVVHETPVYLTDYATGTRYDYEEDGDYVYYTDEDALSTAGATLIRAYIESHNWQLFKASPNFLKKHKDLDNVHHISALADESDIELDAESLRARYALLRHQHEVQMTLQNVPQSWTGIFDEAGRIRKSKRHMIQLLGSMGIDYRPLARLHRMPDLRERTGTRYPSTESEQIKALLTFQNEWAGSEPASPFVYNYEAYFNHMKWVCENTGLTAIRLSTLMEKPRAMKRLLPIIELLIEMENINE